MFRTQCLNEVATANIDMMTKLNKFGLKTCTVALSRQWCRMPSSAYNQKIKYDNFGLGWSYPVKFAMYDTPYLVVWYLIFGSLIPDIWLYDTLHMFSNLIPDIWLSDTWYDILISDTLCLVVWYLIFSCPTTNFLHLHLPHIILKNVHCPIDKYKN